MTKTRNRAASGEGGPTPDETRRSGNSDSQASRVPTGAATTHTTRPSLALQVSVRRGNGQWHRRIFLTLAAAERAVVAAAKRGAPHAVAIIRAEQFSGHDWRDYTTVSAAFGAAMAISGESS